MVEFCPILSLWRKAGVEIELSREGGGMSPPLLRHTIVVVEVTDFIQERLSRGSTRRPGASVRGYDAVKDCLRVYEQGSGMNVLEKLKSGSHSMGFLVTIFYFRFVHVLCFC